MTAKLQAQHDEIYAVPNVRKIIHIDADAFYASLAEREDPSLASFPVAVGGSPHGRGVIATCNYQARKFGVHSAMPSSQALRLCPDLVFVRPDFELYRKVSGQMHEIFARFTELIEPLSLDEAYLDVSECTLLQGSATRIAQAIQAAIQTELGITVSAGVAPNKFLAKVASDWKKPNGMTVISPEKVESFVRELPVRKINGVGKVTQKKLQSIGIETCQDVRDADQTLLIKMFGKQGHRLLELAQGIDKRPVSPSRVRKSLSVENTYDEDLDSVASLIQQLPKLAEELCSRIEKKTRQERINKRFVKLKFNDFTQTTLEQTISGSPENWNSVNAFESMIGEAWERGRKPVRLIGLGVRFDTSRYALNGQQLDLFKGDEIRRQHD
jgi:DNA polymerase-4